MSHRLSPLPISFACCVLLGVLLSGVASADPGPGVYYSQKTVQLGDAAQDVLVPNALRRHMTDDLETNLRAAFKALQNSKRPTYGRSSLDIDPKKLKKGEVTVELDPGKLDPSLRNIVEAEVLATFATLGIKTVNFKADKNVKAMDTSVYTMPVFALVVPIPAALPPNAIPGAQVQMGDGDLIPIAEFQQKLSDGDSKLVRAVLDTLKGGAPAVQVELLARVGALKLDGWEDTAIGLLSKGDVQVQIAAAKAFEGTSDKDALEALKDLVDNKKADPTAQAAAAAALSTSSNASYNSYGAVFALRGDDPNAAITAIQALVDKKAKGQADELVKAVGGKLPAVARRAVVALGELEAEGELGDVMNNDTLPIELRELAAVQLSKSSNDRTARKAQEFLAASASPRAALAALTELAKEKDPEAAARSVQKGLDNPSGRVRRAAAKTLVDIKEDDALKAMGKAAEVHPEDSAAIEAAMVDLLVASERLDDLKDRLRLGDARQRRAAFRALGRKAAQSGNQFKRYRDELTEGVNKQKDALIRGGAILGLAEGKVNEDLALIAALAKDGSPRIREDVARAVGQFPAGTATDVLLALLEDKEPSVVVAAVESLGNRTEKDVLKTLVKLHKGADPAVKIALYESAPKLLVLKERGSTGDVLSLLTNGTIDKDPKVKLAAIAVIGDLQEDGFLDALVPLVTDADPKVRFAVFDALVVAQTKRAGDILGNALVAPSVDNETKLALLDAIVAHGAVSNKKKVQELLKKETDGAVKARAEAALKELK